MQRPRPQGVRLGPRIEAGVAVADLGVRRVPAHAEGLGLGIQPSVAMPQALDASHAAWSAPVWPPLIIRSSMATGSLGGVKATPPRPRGRNSP
jgi:hypothetical protein